MGEVLGSEFHHEEIIDIIKRKRPILIEFINPHGDEGSSKTHVIQVSNKKGEENVANCYQSSRREKQVSFVEVSEDNDDSTYKIHYPSLALGKSSY